MRKSWNKIFYEYGEKVGECIYLYEVYSKTGVRRAMFKCYCGVIFESRIDHVKGRRTKTCGCGWERAVAKSRVKHEMRNSPLYHRWTGMNNRCNNPNDPQYNNYGERGIRVCDAWRRNFKVYHDYMISLPHALEDGYSIDRIDNNGNYEPGNIRWATKHIQNTNKRKNQSNSSGYIGVYRHGNRYSSSIVVYGQKNYFGRFNFLEDALDARNNFIIKNQLTEYEIQ